MSKKFKEMQRGVDLEELGDSAKEAVEERAVRKPHRKARSNTSIDIPERSKRRKSLESYWKQRT